MFFGLFINQVKRMETKGVVVLVLDSAFDVLLVDYGIIKRIYTNVCFFFIKEMLSVQDFFCCVIQNGE